MKHDVDELQGSIVDARIAAFRLLKKKVDDGTASAADITALARMASEVQSMLPMRKDIAPERVPNYAALKLPFAATEAEDYESPLLNADDA